MQEFIGPAGKMTRLILLITMAKICHVRADWETALTYWSRALVTLDQMLVQSTLSTYTRLRILYSIEYIENRDRSTDCKDGKEDGRRNRVNAVALGPTTSGLHAKFWIPGLHDWDWRTDARTR